MGLTKATYYMVNGAPINAFDYMTAAQQQSVSAGDLLVDVTDALQSAIDAASGKQLWLPKGNYLITDTLNLPQQIRITGEVNRGGFGSTITAQFAGPAIMRTAATITPCEIYIEHLFVFGKYTEYGVENGIYIKNSPSFNMHSCVVAGFGNDQIHIDTGAYGCIFRDIYVAETWGTGTSNANIYVAAEFCAFDKIESDAGKYTFYLDAGAYGTDIVNGTFEGWSNSCIYIENQSTLDRNLVQGNKMNNTYNSSYGIYSNSNRLHALNNYIVSTGGADTTGIYLDGLGYNALIVANTIIAGDGTGIYLNTSGGTIITSNDISAGTVGIDAQGGSGLSTYEQIVSNNTIASSGIPLRHNQNSNTSYINNYLNDGNGVYVAPTIVTGTPIIIQPNGSDQFQVVSGAMNFPANSLIVAGGGGTNIVSVGAADSGGTGYRMLRIPN